MNIYLMLRSQSLRIIGISPIVLIIYLFFGFLVNTEALKAEEIGEIEEIKVQAIALFNGKAMLAVNGRRAKIIAAGASLHGVKLLESSTTQAIVEYEGRQETLTLNSATSLTLPLTAEPATAGKTRTVLYSDKRGFFRSRGEVNGQPLSFIVDTGANLVVLSGRQADSIGLEYLDGEPSYAVTASGQAPLYIITLDEISFDGITLKYVKAGVIEGAYPQTPLLGMSFLENLEMSRAGDTMVLNKR